MSHDPLAGCLLGMAVADAWGLPYEGMSPQRVLKAFPDLDRYHFWFGRGMFSDDTQHAIITAQSLLASQGEPKRFIHSLAWRLRGWFATIPGGIGLATMKSCLRLWCGVSPLRSGVFSAGNGTCMRAPVLGVFFRDQPEKLREFLNLSSRITHSDPKAIDGAVAIAIAASIAADPRQSLAKASAITERIVAALPETATELRTSIGASGRSVDEGESTEAFAQGLGLTKGVSGYVLHTVPVVLHAWLRTGDIVASTKALIRCGGDTDTTAAIAGALIGARTGMEGIPQRLLDGMAEFPQNAQWLQKLAGRLSQAQTDPKSVKPLKTNPAGLVVRSLIFNTAVFVHVCRRIFK